MKGLTDSRHTPPEDGTPPAPPLHLDAAKLFREHANFVANFVVRLGMRREEVDDIVQEVFLVAHRRGGFIPGAARPTTWLAEIALRVTSATRRRLRRSREDADVQTVTSASGCPPASTSPSAPFTRACTRPESYSWRPTAAWSARGRSCPQVHRW